MLSELIGGIKNQLRWTSGVVFHDDLMHLRTDHAPAGMATVRTAVLNIIKHIPDQASLKIRRVTLGLSDYYLFDALVPTPT